MAPVPDSYHGFEEDLIKHRMVRDLTQAGLLELAKRTEMGIFKKIKKF